MENCAVSKKRIRDDSDELESNSPESKRVNTNSCPHPDKPESNRVNTKADSGEANPPDWKVVEIEDELDSSENKKIPEDILDILDDTETEPTIQDLDSVIKSFEEEILQTSSSPAQPALVELMSDSAESQPDLGYLFEASDAELGLPPSVSSSEDKVQEEPINIPTENGVALGNMVGLEGELQNYDAFELGMGERAVEGENFACNSNGDFVTVDGLFDYAESSDFSDFAWRPESLSAL